MMKVKNSKTCGKRRKTRKTDRAQMVQQVTGHINDLPNEMLKEIFSYLSAEDLGLSVQNVCVRWCHLCLQDVLWKHLLFSPKISMCERYISSVLDNLPKLQCFQGLETKADILHKLADCCKDLRKLELVYDTFYPNCVEALQNLVTECTNLEELSIPAKAVANEQLVACVGQLSKLHSITLKGLCFLPIKLKPIADNCPSLQNLEMCATKWCYYDMKYFLAQKKNNIRSLGICNTSIDGADICSLLGICKNSLNELHLVDCDTVSDYIESSFSVIKTLPNLTSLKIEIPFTLTADIIANTFLDESMFQLLKLEIISSMCTNAAVVNTVCKNCPNLLSLRIIYCPNLEDDGFKYLHECINLEDLDISNCKSLTDDVIDHIVRCKNLRNLTLGWFHLKERSLWSLLQLSELRHLDLSYSQFAGINIDTFHLRPKKLRKLTLQYCRDIDLKALEILKAQLPHLHVIM